MNFHPVTVVALEPSPPPPLNPRPEEVSRRTAASGGGRGRGSLTGAKKILCFSFFLRKEKEGLKGGEKTKKEKVGRRRGRAGREGGREGEVEENTERCLGG